MSDESEDDDRDKKMVGTEISQERFQRWEKAIEENPEINSKAQAIRVGVEQLLFSDDSEGGQNIDIEQILTRLDSLEQDIAEVRGDVITTQKEIPDVEEIADEVAWVEGKAAKAELEKGSPDKPQQRDHGRY